DEAARAAHNEAFRDHFAAIEMDRETWQRWVTGGQGFRADCSFLVFDGDEIAGYALNSVHPDDWPGLGFTEVSGCASGRSTRPSDSGTASRVSSASASSPG